MPPKSQPVSMYCVRCKARTATTQLKKAMTKTGRPMIQGVCAQCGTKKTQFVKAGGFLGSFFSSLF